VTGLEIGIKFGFSGFGYGSLWLMAMAKQNLATLEVMHLRIPTVVCYCVVVVGLGTTMTRKIFKLCKRGANQEHTNLI